MIILDTDVLSAVMESRKDPIAIAWLDRNDAGEFHTTAINLFEVVLGIEKLAPGHKRTILETALSRLMDEMLKGRVLSFDDEAAMAAGRLHGVRRRGGKPVGTSDTQIAGIALSNNATLATRNTKHFAGLRVPVINPWEA